MQYQEFTYAGKAYRKYGDIYVAPSLGNKIYKTQAGIKRALEKKANLMFADIEQYISNKKGIKNMQYVIENDSKMRIIDVAKDFENSRPISRFMRKK